MKAKLIELLYHCGVEATFAEYERIARELIANGVTLDKDDSKLSSKWIPVTERLPKSAIDAETSENVIVHTIYGEVTTGWLDGSGYDAWWLVIGDDDHNTEHERGYVTHWMPLPEPPKGE